MAAAAAAAEAVAAAVAAAAAVAETTAAMVYPRAKIARFFNNFSQTNANNYDYLQP